MMWSVQLEVYQQAPFLLDPHLPQMVNLLCRPFVAHLREISTSSSRTSPFSSIQSSRTSNNNDNNSNSSDTDDNAKDNDQNKDVRSFFDTLFRTLYVITKVRGYKYIGAYLVCICMRIDEYD